MRSTTLARSLFLVLVFLFGCGVFSLIADAIKGTLHPAPVSSKAVMEQYTETVLEDGSPPVVTAYVNINGRAYLVQKKTFSGGVYRWELVCRVQ